MVRPTIDNKAPSLCSLLRCMSIEREVGGNVQCHLIIRTSNHLNPLPKGLKVGQLSCQKKCMVKLLIQ